MDALLIAFFLNLVAEAGGRTPILYRTLRRRYAGSALVLPGMLIALTANAAIGAFAGSKIAPMLTPEARSLFFAVTLAGGAIGLLWINRGLDNLAGWRIGAFPTALLGLFILGFGDGPAFLTAGVATIRAHPALAAIGGALGGITAVLMMEAVGAGAGGLDRWMKPLRIGAAILFLLIACIVALPALRLV
ncbi:MAG: hypothetical protein B7Z20_05575 [Sphingobium sp. 32-64-5]|nr:MAG: hypothetical protein B7Z20_05575 [Sphingobium sp. 32-64-5]